MRLSELLSHQVVDQNGKKLGHVFEVMGKTIDNDQKILVTEIVFGRKGFLEKLGLLHPKSNKVSWQKVKKVQSGQIVVDR